MEAKYWEYGRLYIEIIYKYIYNYTYINYIQFLFVLSTLLPGYIYLYIFVTVKSKSVITFIFKNIYVYTYIYSLHYL